MPKMQNARRLLRGLVDDIQLRPYYYITMLLALMGAWWAADPSAYWRGWGFSVWLASNGYLLYHFILDRNPPMIVMFFFYEIFNIRGVLSNW